MNSDLLNNRLADAVYKVDPKKVKRTIKKDDTVANGQFKVLKVDNNSTNGMQAMAVAPVVNGVVDLDHITIAYAGTNFGDGKDRKTDFNSVILGQNFYTAPVSVGGASISVPTQSQIDTALAFAAQIRAQYPQANISTTGHSLGGYLGLIAAIKNRWGSTVFNAPSPYDMLTAEEIAWAKAHVGSLVNYRNSKDFIGNYGGDPLGLARYIDTYKSKDIAGLDALYYHGLSTWQFDKHGNLLDKYGLVVDKKNYTTAVDIDGNGVDDIALHSANRDPRNLFLSTGTLEGSTGKKITINPDSLRMLSSNLQLLSMIEIPNLMKTCQLCQEKNSKIKGDFENRKQKVEESIVQRFKQTRLTEVFYQLHDSVGQIINKKHIFQTLSSPGQVVDSVPGGAYLSSGANLFMDTYNSRLGDLAVASRVLYQHSTEEKRTGFQNGTPINPTPTVLKSSTILEKTADKLKKRSEQIFEGKGLREGKKDGISEALDEVLKVEQKNLVELQKAVESVSRLALSLANNFQQMDDWLHGQLSSGGNLEGMTVQSVPSSYQAYLEKSNIFDDVKDVLQAFDTQVEKNSKKYAKEVAEEFASAFKSVQSSLERWSADVKTFNQAVSSIKKTFSISVYEYKKKTVDKEVITKLTYWGKLSKLYPSTTYSNVLSARESIRPLSTKIDSAIEVTRTASRDMKNLKPQLKAIIEEGVYTAFDLDEIVASQKVVQTITGRIIQELSYVRDTISSQMGGEAVSAFELQLGNVQKLTTYFNQLVGDCFGNQMGTSGNAGAEKSHSFSLNS